MSIKLTAMLVLAGFAAAAGCKWTETDMPEKPRRVLQGGAAPFLCVAVSPDGKLVVAGDKAGSISIWDTASGALQRTLKGHGGFVFDVAFSPDGSKLATGGDDKTARIWEVATGKPLAVLSGHENMLESVVFTPDGHGLTTATSGLRGVVRLWDISTQQARVLTLQSEQKIAAERWHETNQVIYTPNGRTLAAAGTRGVLLWDVATETERAAVVAGRSSRLAISPDGKMLISNGSRRISLRDPDSGKERIVLDDPEESGPGSMMAFTGDSKRLVCGHGLGPRQSSFVTIWDIAAGRRTARFVTDQDSLRGLAVFPDGNSLATVSEEGGVKLWDIAPNP